jgi:integrase
MKHSINLQPEHDLLDGRQLEALVRLWLEWCDSRLPAYTVAGYRQKVDYFVKWWREVGPWFNWELSEETLNRFNQHLNNSQTRNRHPLSFNTRKDILRRLRQCLRWAFQRGYTYQRDFSPWVPAPDGSAPLRQRCTLEELAALVDAAGRALWPERDRAFVALLIGTGMRRSEAVGLDVADIRMDADLSGIATIRHAKRVKGRIQQGRVVAFDAWTGSYLARLLDQMPLTGPIFVAADTDRRIAAKTGERIVKRAVARAGLEGRIQGPHDLRRAFTTFLSRRYRDNPVVGRLLSRQLGHSAFAMTSHYILDDADDLRDIIVSPLAGVSQP